MATHALAKVSKENEGSYICKAQNSAGEIEEVIQVIVMDNEVLNRPDYGQNRPDRPNVEESVLAPPGGNARLTCQLVGSARNLRIQWVRLDGTPITPKAYENNGELFFPDVQPSESGAYGCQAVDENGAVIYVAVTNLIIACK